MPRSVSQWRALLPREIGANECAVRIWTHCDHSFDGAGYAYMSLYDLANAIEALRSDGGQCGAKASDEKAQEPADSARSENAASPSSASASRRRHLFYRLIFGAT
jgi:hypothetical protein